MRRFLHRRRRLLAVGVAFLLGAAAVLMVAADVAASDASSQFQSSRQQLDGHLLKAEQAGFTEEDLAPVATRAQEAESAPAPLWVGDRAAFFRQQAATLKDLDVQLTALQARVLDRDRSAAAASIQEARNKIGEDHKLGVEDNDLAPVQVQLDQVAKAAESARAPKEFRAVASDAKTVSARAAEIGSALAAELASLQKAADDLKAQNGGNIDSIRLAGRGALAGARNDSTTAAFLHIDAPNKPYRTVERYGRMMDSADVNQVALGSAGVQRYGSQVHEALTKAMPHHTIVVSLAAQHLWAYDDGKVAMDTIVTTGRPHLETDVGPMKVLWKVSPWTMHSPWPKGSPYWYPDSKVRKVLWFTNSGEGLHDAPWRGWYGPGSNFGDGTHGCINLPGGTVDFLYDWAAVGTPVIVIPGDGATQVDQIKRDTIDDPASASAPHGA